MLSGNLPNDVTEDILSRLPTESLVRFKLVCKSWYVLVRDPSFIAKHHRTRTEITNNGCVLIKRLRHHPKDYVFSLIYSATQVFKCVDLEPPFLKGAKMKYANVNAYCNGIFCTSPFLSYSVVLWNPAIREFKFLPKFHEPKPPPNLISKGGSLGFGFDSKTNDYKVIWIWAFIDHYTNVVSDKYRNKVEVYTVSGNSWREIDAVPPVAITPSGSYVYIKGRCYWHVRPSFVPEKMVSFDMGDEVFQVIQLPDARIAGTNDGYWWNIAELNESIALISSPVENSNKKSIEIWLMHEFGGQVSWAKYKTLYIPLSSYAHIGFWKNGDLLLQEKYGNLISYNPISQETIDLQSKVSCLDLVIIYNESLVSFKGGNGLEDMNLY